MPGRTTARGYDAQHRRIRRDWEARIAREGHVPCWRCGHPITTDTPWHLGHDDNDRSITRGPEHDRTCNLAAAGRKSHANRPKRRRPAEPHPGLL